jgi:hypothetical protein
MPLPLQTFDQLVINQATAVTSASDKLIDFNVGSILRAIVESNAGNSIWIQGLISALLAVARLQTSAGADVDSFVTQFGYARKAGVAAVGNVTFSRSITTSVSSIPASTTRVQTSLNQIVFQTYVDSSNPNYDAVTNSYLMDVGVSSITVPVQCLTVGIVGNVSIGAINTIASALVNVNNVNNTVAFTTGSNEATDSEVKAGFVLYLAGLSKATYSAVASVVASYPGVLRYLIVENESESGVEQLGYFYVVIDNGLGTISDDIRNAVYAQISSVRGLAIQWNVDKATPNALSSITADIIVDAETFASTTAKAAITATIKQNIVNFLGTLGIGATFYITRLAQLIYDASTHIIDTYNIQINGGIIDIPGDTLEVITIDPSLISLTYHAPA